MTAKFILEMESLTELTLARAAFHASAQHYRNTIECLLIDTGHKDRPLLLEYYEARHRKVLEMLNAVNALIANYYKNSPVKANKTNGD